MIVIPAIDILDGVAVRLYKGDYNKRKKVSESILETALGFERDKASYIHLVDLNGAKIGKGVNHHKVMEVASKVKVPIEVGGGIRDIDTVSRLINNGVSRVILGTSAVKDEAFLKEAIYKYKDKIAVGVDFNDGLVCTDGWTSKSNLNYIDFCKYLEGAGVGNIIVTDISTDGTLKGPNLDMLRKIKENVSINITASGGIKDIKDIEKINSLGLYAVIVGKAIYEGKVRLKEAIELLNNSY